MLGLWLCSDERASEILDSHLIDFLVKPHLNFGENYEDRESAALEFLEIRKARVIYARTRPGVDCIATRLDIRQETSFSFFFV